MVLVTDSRSNGTSVVREGYFVSHSAHAASKEGTRAVRARRRRVQMKRYSLSINCTDNYSNDWIVRIIGVVIPICGAVMLFIVGSTGALAEIWNGIRVCLFRL